MPPAPPPSAKKKDRDLSPPAYTVESTMTGELYNWKHQVMWPRRPKRGNYSAAYETGRVSASDMQPAGVCVTVSEMNTEMPVKQCELRVCPNEEPTEYLIRAMSTIEATISFGRYQWRNFMIYYKVYNCITGGINSIPLEVPLLIACKDKNIVTHFRTKCYLCKDDSGNHELWCAIKLDHDGEAPVDERKNWRLGFSSIQKLLDYYCSLNANCTINAI